jgi:hypothetical protein
VELAPLQKGYRLAHNAVDLGTFHVSPSFSDIYIGKDLEPFLQFSTDLLERSASIAYLIDGWWIGAVPCNHIDLR